MRTDGSRRRDMNPYKVLMQNLLYPAVLGSAFFAFLSTSLLSAGGIELSHRGVLSAILFVYFSLSYLANEKLELQNHPSNQQCRYGAMLFMLDLAELLLVILAFISLGFFKQSTAFDNVQLRDFYTCLAMIPLVECLWDIAAGKFEYPVLFGSLLISVALLFARYYGESCGPCNWIIGLLLVISLILYGKRALT